MVITSFLVGCPPQQRQVMEKVLKDSLIWSREVCKKKQLKTSTLGLDASSWGCYRPPSMPPSKQNIVKEGLEKPSVYVLQLGNKGPGAGFSTVYYRNGYTCSDSPSGE